MRKKLIVILLIIALLITTIPITTAKFNNKIGTTQLEKYSNCYIEISGLLSINDYPRIVGAQMWKILFLRTNGAENPEAFVLYWYLLLDEKAEISIYTQENGELLWQHDGMGEPVLRILWFSGDYVPTSTQENRLHVDINGQIKSVWIKEY